MRKSSLKQSEEGLLTAAMNSNFTTAAMEKRNGRSMPEHIRYMRHRIWELDGWKGKNSGKHI
eukprot:4603872-Karenia_brevis.AAC.1